VAGTLYSWDKDKEKWIHSRNNSYGENEEVKFRFELKLNKPLSVPAKMTVDHDYQEDQDGPTGFVETIESSIKVLSGVQEMTSDTAYEIVEINELTTESDSGGAYKFLRFKLRILDNSVDAVEWKTLLSDEAGGFTGATLHARVVEADSAIQFMVDESVEPVLIPGIDIDKTTNGTNGPKIQAGDAVTWMYAVTNTGNTDLASVSVIDSDGDVNPEYYSGDSGDDEILSPDETWIYSATGTAVTGSYSNIATASALYDDANSVEASDDSYYTGLSNVVITKAFEGFEGAEFTTPDYVVFTLEGEFYSETLTATAASDWKVTFDGLELESYKLTEESLGEGWTSSIGSGYSFDLNGAEKTIDVTNTYTPFNDSDPGTVTIYKTFEGYEKYVGDPPIGDLIFDVGFTIFDSNDKIEDTLYPTSITVDGWSGMFDDVDSGEGYYVVEIPFTWAGDGYWTYSVSPTAFNVVEGGNTDVNIVNIYHTSEEKGSIVIHKDEMIWEELINVNDGPPGYTTSTPMADVEFVVKATSTSAVELYSGRTDELGQVEFSDIKYGTYWVEEVVPEGYISGWYDDGYVLGAEGKFVTIGSNNETEYFNVDNWYVNYEFTKDVSPESTTSNIPTYTLTIENTGDFPIFIDKEAVYDDYYETVVHPEYDTVIDVASYYGPSDGTFPVGYTEIVGEWESEGYLYPGLSLVMVFDYPDSISRTSSTQTIDNTATASPIFKVRADWTEYSVDYELVPQSSTASFTIPGTGGGGGGRDYDLGIKIDKDVDLDEASVGDTVVYTIEVENNGDYDLENVIVEDEMIDETWNIGDLDEGEDASKTFRYTLQEGDFDEDGLFVNTAVVTGEWRGETVEANDKATVEELIIEVTEDEVAETTPELPDVVPEKVVLPAPAVPQALPKTGQVPPELFYGLGSILMAAGYRFGRKKKD